MGLGRKRVAVGWLRVRTPSATLTRRFASATPETRLSLRAAFCLSAPLIVGLIVNQRSYSIIFAIGALWAISQDGLDEWRVRGPRLFWVAIAAGVGASVGASVVTHDSAAWVLVVLFSATAFVAGVIEASGWAARGAYLLIGTIIGGGLHFTGKVWQSCLLLTLGGLWVFAVAALTDQRRLLNTERVVLAKAFRSLANLVDVLGTPEFFEARARGVATLDAAQDVVGGRGLLASSDEELALHQCLVVALRCGEVVSYLAGKGLRADPSISLALRDVATALRDNSGLAATEVLRNLPAYFQTISGLDPVITEALQLADPAVLRTSPPNDSFRRTTRHLMSPFERGRFALILTLAVGSGTLIAQAIDTQHNFWLPMSVAFILRPDLGPVITRAAARSVGTVVGVAIAAVVAVSGNAIWLLILLSCAMAALQPRAARRSHVLGVICFTPIVFVFLSLLGTEHYLFVPRIVDTLLGSAIVFILDVVLWSRAPSLRPAQQLVKAQRAATRYQDEALRDDPIRRHLLRRSALRAVANARSALDQARAEPHPLRRPDSTTFEALDDIEASIDATTVALLERGSLG
jgi:uncharacterized membrane protein YccC